MLNIKNAIPTKIKFALAQFDLLGLVPLLKAQTNNMTIPTMGIANKNNETSQLPIDIGG